MSASPQLNNQDLLKSSALFSELNSHEIERLFRFAQQKSYPANKVLFYQGDEGNHLYAILNGKVQISVASEMGKELTFGIMNTGEIFGEIAVFNDALRIATARTLEKSELLILDKHALLPFLKSHPDVAIKIIASLCKRLTAFNADMEDILFYGLPKRLAKKLLSLMELYGSEENDGTIINMRLSQTALGNMVSASRESVNKQMKVWVSRDLLSYEHGIIKIIQEDVLEDIAFSDD